MDNLWFVCVLLWYFRTGSAAIIIIISFPHVIITYHSLATASDAIQYKAGWWAQGKSNAVNCKILHGGMLLQPWPNAFRMLKHFNGNYVPVIPSPKSSEGQKMVFTWNWRVFVPEIKWRPKEKKSSWQFGTTFSQNLWDLFVLTDPCLSDCPALRSRWGDTKSRWRGVLNLDGGMLSLKRRMLTLNGGASPQQFKYWSNAYINQYMFRTGLV